MICPALSHTECPSDNIIFMVFFAGYDVIKLVPMFGMSVHPSGLVNVRHLEDSTSNGKVMLSTEAREVKSPDIPSATPCLSMMYPKPSCLC